MKVTTMFAVAALPYAPLALAGNKAACPNEKVVQFVVEKLDVTSLPSAIRPKKEKAKKTSADYGFTARSLDEHEAILEAPGGTRKFSRWRGKDAKCFPAEKKGFESVVKRT